MHFMISLELNCKNNMNVEDSTNENIYKKLRFIILIKNKNDNEINDFIKITIWNH